jgi:SAM-dependent methyltransferase
MGAASEADFTKRFSNRVEYYIKYRPTYPDELIQFMRRELGLSSLSIIADIGSGTGILSELFLKHGNLVFGVEPNKEMREAAESLLKEYPAFKSIDGSAESTTLDPHCVDFVTAGQAFHWFDIDKSRAELARITKPNGWIVLVWNTRKTDSTPFLKSYEEFLLNCGVDYEQVKHRHVDEKVLSRFFGARGYKSKALANVQEFDYEGLKGRVLSSSYVPLEGHLKYEPMIKELHRIFHEHEVGGLVRFEYDTEIYYGQIE